VLAKGIPHAVDLLHGAHGAVAKTHHALQAQAPTPAVGEVGLSYIFILSSSSESFIDIHNMTLTVS
jgi:hypothetical protein